MLRSLRRVRRVGFATSRLIKTAILVLLFFLLQTTVMPHLKIWGAMANLNMVIIAILTVSLGKKYAFASAATIGIIMESMARNINSFYIIVYPTLALIFAQVFADMSDVKREFRRVQLKNEEHTENLESTLTSRKKRFRLKLKRTSPDDLNPHLRILLNAVVLHASYEIIMMLYAMLNGIPLSFHHIFNMVKAISYTALSCVTMYPVRAFLGMYPRRIVKQVGDDLDQYPENISRTDWKMITMIPDNPTADSLHGFELRRDGEVEKIKTEIDDSKETKKAEETKSPVQSEPRKPIKPFAAPKRKRMIFWKKPRKEEPKNES